VKISKDITEAAQLLKEGQVIAMPTETVYGLAANALDPTAISEVYKVKERPATNPLIVHIHTIDQLTSLVIEMGVNAQRLAEHLWPGPLTLLLKKTDRISDQVTAGSPLVAIRIPKHPMTLELLKTLDFPRVAPSANRYTTVSPTSAEHVAKNLGERIPLILDGGACEKGLESTVVGFDADDRPLIYRLGAVTLEDIQSLVPEAGIYESALSEPAHSPGMAKKHYAPKTALKVVDDLRAFLENYSGDQKLGVLSFGHQDLTSSPHTLVELSQKRDLEEGSQRLYQSLYALDEANVDFIVAEWFEDKGLGQTLNDKLKRASTDD
jgi:L-threonylcarbamoyladenylate synthase